MNYYEHHLRDYDAATSHLSWDEDLAYTRLLRWYYRKERPIPAEVAEACRQVRATTKVQRDAVDSVLHEFFDLREDGWHQDKCDEAIAEYRAGEPEREAKKKNEDTRLSRHRAERAALFATINGSGMHLPYNAPIADVRKLAEQVRNGNSETPATAEPKTATRPATGAATPATATHTPAPKHQAPDTIPQKGEIPEQPPPGREAQTVAGGACGALRRAGLPDTNPSHPVLLALLAAGATEDELVALVPQALDKRNPFKWLLVAAQGQREDAAKAATGLRATAGLPAIDRNAAKAAATAEARRQVFGEERADA